MEHLAYVAPSAEKAAKIPRLQNCEPCIRIRRFPTCFSDLSWEFWEGEQLFVLCTEAQTFFMC